MAYDNNKYGSQQNSDRDSRNESIYSKRVKAGKRRTYFFDVRATRGNDYFITITESKKRSDDNGYERHKMFLYKEDFNKFLTALSDTIGYVKTDLMPDFDFDAFNHEDDEYPVLGEQGIQVPAEATMHLAEPEAPVAYAEVPAAPIADDGPVNVDEWKM